MDFQIPDSGLPLIDEHRTLVAAPVQQTWTYLTEWVTETRLGVSPGFARIVGTNPLHTTGTPPDQGSTFPGFAITESLPGTRLTLTGRHRFSAYELSFVLSGQTGGTSLGARSYGFFPGLPGAAYRFLVINAGFHRHAVRRMLRQISRKAE
ncbi:hypothetical protein [Streptomyces sp. SID8352]|uniref:hypothetical protein n=1 Tax=Streptomyces sp. SID8352 TaxID=2690338 RepID=UPI001928DA86|nr:hypothetical protein [Streptomyces sp. SID8352]